MNKAITFSAALVAVASAQVNDFRFMQWASKHNKSYSTIEEYAARLANWVEIDAFVEEVNHPESEYTHTAAHNHMSDFTREEYEGMLGLLNAGEPDLSAGGQHVVTESNTFTVDWVSAGKVYAVKNQEQCGSCYSFSTTCSTESAVAIKDNASPISLSEQQLVDCTGSYGNQGCNGGWYYYNWEYLKTHVSEYNSDYPYVSGDGVTTPCTYNSADGVTMTNSTTPYNSVAGNTTAIESAINQQPVSVAIQANSFLFQTYSSGIITSTSCGTNIDHAVTAVGYGNTNGTEFYYVQNSWGASWGDNGYVSIEATNSPAAGICGIN